MKRATITSDHWKPCLSGELTSLARKLRAQRRDGVTARIVGATGAVLLVCLMVGLVSQQVRDLHNRLGDISCAEVKAELAAYVDGRLNIDRAKQIRVHLEECPSCAAIYQDLVETLAQEEALNAVHSARSATLAREFTAPIALAHR